MGDIVNRHKPFELNRFEFGLIVGIWEGWKGRNRHLLQEPVIKALDDRMTKHFEDAYRFKVS